MKMYIMAILLSKKKSLDYKQGVSGMVLSVEDSNRLWCVLCCFVQVF